MVPGVVAERARVVLLHPLGQVERGEALDRALARAWDERRQDLRGEVGVRRRAAHERHRLDRQAHLGQALDERAEEDGPGAVAREMDPDVRLGKSGDVVLEPPADLGAATDVARALGRGRTLGVALHLLPQGSGESPGRPFDQTVGVLLEVEADRSFVAVDFDLRPRCKNIVKWCETAVFTSFTNAAFSKCLATPA